MADYDLPDDLLQLKVDFLAAENDASKYQEAQDLALAIHRHEWWATVEQRYDASMALLATAKKVREDQAE